MCVVSNMGDYFDRHYPWPPKYPPVPPWPTWPPIVVPQGPTKEQFEEFLRLLRQALKFDRITGQPDCQIADKLAKVKAWGKLYGIDIEIEITDNDS